MIARTSSTEEKDRKRALKKISAKLFNLLVHDREPSVTAELLEMCFRGLGRPISKTALQHLFWSCSPDQPPVAVNRLMKEGLDLEQFTVVMEGCDGKLFGEGVSMKMVALALNRQENLKKLLQRPDHVMIDDEDIKLPVVVDSHGNTPAKGYRLPKTPSRRSKIEDPGKDKKLLKQLKTFGVNVKEFLSKEQQVELPAIPPGHLTTTLLRGIERDLKMSEVDHDSEPVAFLSKQMRTVVASRSPTKGLNQGAISRIAADPFREIHNFKGVKRRVKSSLDI